MSTSLGYLAAISLFLYYNFLRLRHKYYFLFFMIVLSLVSFAAIFILVRDTTASDNVHERENITQILLKDSFYFGESLKTVFIPKNRETQLLMDLFTSLMRRQFSLNVTVKGFLSETEAEEAVMKEKNHMDYTFVEFEGVTSTSTRLPHSMKVTIRPFIVMDEFIDTEQKFRTRYPIQIERKPQQKGVVFLQVLITEALVNYWLGYNGRALQLSQLNVSTQVMSNMTSENNYILNLLAFLLHFLVLINILPSVVTIITTVVHEKIIKESLKLVGVKSVAYWTGWFLYCSLIIFLVMAMHLRLLMGRPLVEKALLTHSDKSLIMVFLSCYGLALFTFSLMASTFFKKGDFGALMTGALLVVAHIMSLFFYQEDPQKRTKYLPYIGSLMFNTAFYIGIQRFVDMELEERGVKWTNMGSTIHENDLSFRTCLLMLLLDSALHVLIGWYVDNINPGGFGVPQPYLFFFYKSYWSSSKKPSDNIQLDQQQIPDNKYFQKVPQGTPIGIQVLKLTKVFGKTVAVSEVSFDVPKGEITVLIGHSGAGKTTLISMLTGSVTPTSGTAIIGGYDIRKNCERISEILGVCPKHDFLFDNITVKNHLLLFGWSNNRFGSSLKAELALVAIKIGLSNQLEIIAGELTAGQKKLLSIGLALICHSQVLILDEPTSGVDPEARPQIWSLLHQIRYGRTILLTTQNTDEAEILGENIAIMSEGVLQFYGSSQFLKKAYGGCYYLTVVTNPNCKVEQLTQVVKTRIPSAQVENIVNTEVSYLLPDDVGGQLSELFTYLEDNKSSLNIVSYGITPTTMDKVVSVIGLDSNDDTPGRSADPDENKGSSELVARTPTPRDPPESSEPKGPVKSDYNKMSAVDMDVNVTTEVQLSQEMPAFNQGFVKKTDMALLKSRVAALVIKKLIITRRTWLFSLFQVVVPFAILALLTIPSGKEISINAKLICSINIYDETYIPYSDGLRPNERATLLKEIYRMQFSRDHYLEYFSGNNENFDNFILKRREELGYKDFRRKVVIGMEVISDDMDDNLSVVAYYNEFALHSELISVNHVMNAYLRLMLNDSFSIQTSFQPKQQISDDALRFSKKVASYKLAMTMAACISLAILTAMLAYYPLKERQMGAKQLQFMSGVGPLTYWLTTFVWDLTIFMVASLPLFGVIVVYKMDVYLDDGRWFLVILILLAYAWAALPMVYAVSFIFKTPAAAMVALFILFVSTGTVRIVMEENYLTVPFVIEENLLAIFRTSLKIFSYILMVVCPIANFVEALFYIALNEVNKQSCQPYLAFCAFATNPCCKESCGEYCTYFEDNPMSLGKYGIGMSLLVMSCQGVIYFLVILWIENWKIFFWKTKASLQDYDQQIQVEEDSDVAAERQRITSTPIFDLLSTDLLVINNLSKRSKSLLVKPICLGIPKQEIFGLLGQNGAGKSTVFKMLVGEVKADSGNAYLSGFDINLNKRKVQTNMGYCPQFDGLIDVMTSKENLFMYARLRGIPESEIPRVVEDLIARLVILPDGDTLASKLSGGNRRKLSVAIALIGDPLFILLDEPSSSMDPAAKRQLWSVLSSVRASGRTLMLTSHSSEECEVLCSRLAIMVKGNLMCLGSSQYLKNKFGQGFTIRVKLGNMEDGNFSPVEPVINFINSNFPNTKVFDDKPGYLEIQVLDPDIKLAIIFSILESAKSDQIVADYSVQKTTLEQAFWSFVRTQN